MLFSMNSSVQCAAIVAAFKFSKCPYIGAHNPCKFLLSLSTPELYINVLAVNKIYHLNRKSCYQNLASSIPLHVFAFK